MDDTQKQANTRLVRRLGLVVVGMFGFAFALVPLYNVFCNYTGLNGKTGRVDISQVNKGGIDATRTITVEFTAQVHQGLPWSFKPLVHKMTVHPGVVEGVSFVARNLVAEPVTGRAVPSLAPGLAAKYFNKTECFCFSQQTLQARETVEMPVRFIVDPGLPSDVRTVTLSYTFFKVKDKDKDNGKSPVKAEEISKSKPNTPPKQPDSV